MVLEIFIISIVCFKWYTLCLRTASQQISLILHNIQTYGKSKTKENRNLIATRNCSNASGSRS